MKLGLYLGYWTSGTVVADVLALVREAEAEAALPLEYIDEVALCGSVDRIAAGLDRYREGGATTLLAIPIGVTFEQRLDAVRGLAAAADRAEVRAP